jgi:dihydroneopterin aldolase
LHTTRGPEVGLIRWDFFDFSVCQVVVVIAHLHIFNHLVTPNCLREHSLRHISSSGTFLPIPKTVGSAIDLCLILLPLFGPLRLFESPSLGLAFPAIMSSKSFVIRTPCSSANIGPGFDVIGLALSLYLELQVTIDCSKTSSQQPLNCVITYDDQSNSSEKISLDPEVNLITRVALYVLRCHDQRAFPVETRVHIVNPIPLGRGLGSSGTAVVAGVMLGNEVGQLGLSKDRLLDYCLMIGKSLLICISA